MKALPWGLKGCSFQSSCNRASRPKSEAHSHSQQPAILKLRSVGCSSRSAVQSPCFMKQTRISTGSYEMVPVLTSTLIFYVFARISGKPDSHTVYYHPLLTTVKTHSTHNSNLLYTHILCCLLCHLNYTCSSQLKTNPMWRR